MSFLEKMKTRYTTKKYNPNGKINKETIEQLKQILSLSPSSINSQPWKFTFVTDAGTKLKFADISRHNKEKIINCGAMVIFQVIDDVNSFEKQIEENLPEGSVNYYKTYIQPQGEAQIKIWLSRQVYISLGIFLAACAEMNIDSTPMEGIENDKYDAVLNSLGYQTLFAVTIGTRDGADANQPAVKPKARLNPELVIQEI
jgi:Nitroreductase